MTTAEAMMLLDRFREGGATRDEVIRAFQQAPVADLGFAQVDLHRSLRKNCPEVIYAEGKTAPQVVAIARRIVASERRVLVTRVLPAHARALRRAFPSAAVHQAARCVTLHGRGPRPRPRPGLIAIVCAGTSDLAVAEEAAVTAEFMGNRILRITDVGVAGIHRLLARLPDLQKASVLITIAGMEGALPSVVAGLVNKPIIAVPTSVGYGTSFQGVTALLAMLNSCSSGLTVVNINNGFGAAYAASQINALAAGELA